MSARIPMQVPAAPTAQRDELLRRRNRALGRWLLAFGLSVFLATLAYLVLRH